MAQANQQLQQAQPATPAEPVVSAEVVATNNTAPAKTAKKKVAN
jgi:hypothetical protein